MIQIPGSHDLRVSGDADAISAAIDTERKNTACASCLSLLSPWF